MNVVAGACLISSLTQSVVLRPLAAVKVGKLMLVDAFLGRRNVASRQVFFSRVDLTELVWLTFAFRFRDAELYRLKVFAYVTQSSSPSIAGGNIVAVLEFVLLPAIVLAWKFWAPDII